MGVLIPDRVRGSALVLQLVETVELHCSTESLRFSSGDRTVTLREPTPGLIAAVRALESGARLQDLQAQLHDREGTVGLALWMSVVRRLEAIAGLRYTLQWGDTILGSLVPGRTTDGIAEDPPPGPVVLSRFGYLRRQGTALELDSPLGVGPLVVVSSGALLSLALLTQELDCSQLGDTIDSALGGGAEEWLPAWCGFLRSAGLVVDIDGQGHTAEDQHPALRSWEFADLLMHSRSRSTRADQPIGGTFPGRGVTEPLPALRPLASAEITSLPVPDLAALARSDASLWSVMEARRSVRRHGQRPMDVAQLSEFLHRAARIVPDRETPVGPGSFEITRRVAPSGGSCHPLEVYVVVGNCRGLSPGVYHYDPAGHRLARLDATERDLGLVLDSCQGVMEDGGRPQILLCLTARFRRASWKYQGVAYTNVLKDVGVLYEAMYLIATAMGLAPCALGGGDTAAIVAMLGLDPLEEGPVGEFLLGSVFT